MVFKPRISGEQLYHHIYAWGNDRHPIFKAELHYQKYLHLLETYSSFYGVDVIAYALMKWHIHLFIYDTKNHLSRFMKDLHGEYAKFYNRHAKRVGHVFGERFNNKIVQVNDYGLWLSRYIHRQAVEAGIVQDPKDYQWSSYRIYLGLEKSKFVKRDIILQQFGNDGIADQRYEAFVKNTEDDPINWGDRSFAVVGDDTFKENYAKTTQKYEQKEENVEAIAEAIFQSLQISKQILLNPQGLNERRLRHQACRILVMEYGFTKAKVSRLLGVSKMAVVKALRK